MQERDIPACDWSLAFSIGESFDYDHAHDLSFFRGTVCSRSPGFSLEAALSHIVVCTICSEKKHAGQALMPAIQRYDSDRISKVFAESQRRALLFRILSGRFGLLRPERPIPCYGLLLEADRVGEMAGLAARQLQEEAVSIVVFYARRTADWEPYRQVLEKACERAKVQLLEVEWRS